MRLRSTAPSTSRAAGAGRTACRWLTTPSSACRPQRWPVTVQRAQRLQMAHTFSDVASVKSRPLLEAETLGVDMSSFVGGHPMAGRENAGPWNARGDLFRSRPWPLVTTAATSTEALAAAVALAEVCGALPELWTSAHHDARRRRRLAPAAAGRQRPGGEPRRRRAATSSSWPAPDCATPPAWPAHRPACGPTSASRTPQPLAPRLRQVIAELTAVEQALHASENELAQRRRCGLGGAVSQLISAGNAVHRRLPQKRWSRLATGVSYGYVSVFVPDQPGGFADILRALADASVNVEDITVDHVPGSPAGPGRAHRGRRRGGAGDRGPARRRASRPPGGSMTRAAASHFIDLHAKRFADLAR